MTVEESVKINKVTDRYIITVAGMMEGPRKLIHFSEEHGLITFETNGELYNYWIEDIQEITIA